MSKKPIDDCIPGIGTLTRHGYRVLQHEGRQVREHRLAWFEEYGEWPKQVLDHLCRNRECRNVDHLEDVSIGENVRRGDNFHRSKTVCKKGHPFSHRDSQGKRCCIVCRRESQRERRARVKAN